MNGQALIETSQSGKHRRIMGMRRERCLTITKSPLYSCLEGFMDAGMNLITINLVFSSTGFASGATTRIVLIIQ